jgi:hypothetical protein
MKLSNLLWLGLIGLMLAGLFQVKYEVQKLEHTLAGIRKQSGEIRETIGILTAEWNYLNRPERLAKLSKPLGLAPVSNSQLATFATLPQRFDLPSVDPTAKPTEVAPKVKRRRTRR